MEGEHIRVGILEDQQVFRESLVAVLEREGFEVVAHCSDSETFMARVHEATPDVALVDLRLEHLGSNQVSDGQRVLNLLHDFYPNVRTLVLSGNRDPEVIQHCMRAGAAGFLSKLNVGCSEVAEAVRRVARGERLGPPEALSAGAPAREEPAMASSLMLLTPREREVLGYIAAGADNLKIAACLGITERTVKAHITSIYRKLGEPENRTQMAMLACRLGIERPASL
jgi:DNA-binding NarL/FixJ family response regulator